MKYVCLGYLEPLQPANTAVTLDWKNGKAAVTDGPYAETKEQLVGIQVLEARDLNHAIQLISQSPNLRLVAAARSDPYPKMAQSASWRGVPPRFHIPRLQNGIVTEAGAI